MTEEQTAAVREAFKILEKALAPRGPVFALDQGERQQLTVYDHEGLGLGIRIRCDGKSAGIDLTKSDAVDLADALYRIANK